MNNRKYTKIIYRASKHFISTVLLISSTTILLSACSDSAVSDETAIGTESSQGETVKEQSETNTISAEKEEPTVALTETELEEFSKLFNTDEYNGFLQESYNSPDDINWDIVLEFGAGLSVQDVSENEIRDYLESIGEKELYGDLFVIRKGDLAEYIIQHTGLSNIADDVLSWDYVPKYDSYYKEHWAAHQNQYTCVSGEKSGNHYELRFRVNSEELPGANAGKNYGKWADRVLKMNKTSDTIVLESNAIQWDDYCDEEQTFDVELSQYDGPVHLVTYSVNPDEADITIVKDGKFLSDLYTSIYSENGTNYLKKIIAVGFFDFNCDGKDDIAVIGDSDFGKHVLLYESVHGDYPFETFADLNEEKMSEMGCDFTIAGVKEALLGDKQEEQYSSYQDLYAHLAKLYSIQDDKNQFDLIYADDDDIPEFVVGYAGYWVSLVAYEDGKAHYLMNRWPYGAGGNGGYSYAPKKGIYYNGNADHAGAIYYNTYMSKRDEGELGTDYWVKDINFNDLDGDGWPSEDELQASGEYVGSSEYYNETGKDMTEEEIKAVISLYESYEMKQISGRMDYPTFLDKLAGKEVGITEEQALAAIKNYCIEQNADLKSMLDSEDYTVYWNVESIDDTDIVVLYRSYTGSQLRYYIDRFSGSTYSKEFVPGITEEEQWTDEYFNVKDYMD